MLWGPRTSPSAQANPPRPSRGKSQGQVWAALLRMVVLDAIGIVLDSHPHGTAQCLPLRTFPSDVPFIAPHAVVPQPWTTLLQPMHKGLAWLQNVFVPFCSSVPLCPALTPLPFCPPLWEASMEESQTNWSAQCSDPALQQELLMFVTDIVCGPGGHPDPVQPVLHLQTRSGEQQFQRSHQHA